MATVTRQNPSKVVKYIKRNSYIIMILVGTIMIIVAVIVYISSAKNMSSGQEISLKNSIMYDVLMGTGCGFLATGLGTMLITFLLADITESKENLDEWGIEGIYSERMSPKDADLPKKQLDIAAFGLSHFRSNIHDSVLESHIKEGLEIRILIPNPRSEFIAEQQKQCGNKNLETDIMSRGRLW